jgi:integrase/recombinase XerD
MNSEKPILQLMDEFLSYQDVRENTRKKYRDSLHVFINWLTRNADVSNIVRQTIIAYKKHLIESGKAASTVDNYLVSVRQFFRYLEDSGVHDNVAAGVHSPKKYMGYRKGYLKPEEVNSMLSSINRNNVLGKRDYAIINLMVRTGMRCIEVARADVGDLTTEQQHWIIMIQGKGHWEKDRPLGLSDKAVAPIKEYLNELDHLTEKSSLFQNHSYVSPNTRISTLTISKIIKKYLRLIGIDSSKITAHSLRHTAAITALRSDATLSEVQHMLGHRSPNTTMIYLRAIEEELRREGTAVGRLDNAYETSKKNSKREQFSIINQLHR